MKEINTKDAVGHVLCHDITQIVKDKVKGVAFKKGHVVRTEDIEKLLSLGKDHLYVWEKKEGILHENEAVVYLRDICKNEYMEETEVKEGKIYILEEDLPKLTDADNTKIAFYAKTLGYEVVFTKPEPKKKNTFKIGNAIAYIEATDKKYLKE